MTGRILVYHVGGIGDTIAALPAFRMLQANFPGSAFDLLNLSAVPSLIHAELYENTDLFGSRVFLRPACRPVLYARFATAALRRKYDALYCFSPALPRSLALAFRIRNGNRIFHCAPVGRFPDLPLAEAYLEILGTLGLARPGGDLFAFPVAEEEARKAASVRESLPSSPLIAFGIGGNKQACRWPADRYGALIRILRTRHDFTPVFIGGSADRTIAEPLADRTGGIFLPGTVCRSLRETIAFLRLCRGYVGNDTGSIHLAEAAGIPCVGIFSAHNPLPARWTPFTSGSRILRHAPDCAGCGAAICPEGDPAPCIASVTAEEAAEAAEQALFGPDRGE